MGKIGLIVAGLDPSGGAGIILDTKVFQYFGVPSAGVITANTVQNSCGVKYWKPIDKKLFIDQLEAIKEDLPIGVIKVGMLAKGRFLEILVDSFKGIPTVVDPVLGSKNRYPLVDREEIYLDLAEEIFLLTPNWEEAKRLVRREGNPEEVVFLLREKGFKNVLLKGGHVEGRTVKDYLLLEDGRLLVFEKERVGKRPRGTGCALASAIAASLLSEGNLEKAALRAERFIEGAIKKATKLGRCHEHLIF